MTSRKARGRVVSPDQKLRIALSIGQLGRGGAEGQLALLTEELVERGHAVHVAALYNGGPLEKRFRDAGAELFFCHFPIFRSRPDASPTFLDFVKLPRSAFRFVLAFVRYVRWLRSSRPHVVMSFLFHAYVISAFAARTARVAVIVAGRRSLGTFKQDRGVLQLLERLANQLTDAVVANSEAVGLDVMGKEKLPPAKLHIIHNGLPTSAFEGHQDGQLSEHRNPRVICVANLRSYKGHRYLLQAIARLGDTGQHTSLVLIGDGPLEGELRDTVRRQKLDVTFVGSTSNVHSFLQSADIFVLPSLEEGFSNALLEAMAVGLPIVATDVGGNAEALKETGLLVPARDSIALAEAIASLIEDPSKGARLGQSARERALSEFHAGAMVSHYIDLFHVLLCGTREALQPRGD